MLQDFTPALLLVFAVTADAFISSFAYGAKKIRIPFSSCLVITIICSGILTVSLYAGELIRPYLPGNLAEIISFLILFILGVYKLFDKSQYSDKDKDHSQSIETGEAVVLAAALSLDGLAAGVGTALGGANKPLIIVMSLIAGVIAITLGCFIGNKAVSRTSKVDFSWVGGAGLIALAIHRLF